MRFALDLLRGMIRRSTVSSLSRAATRGAQRTRIEPLERRTMLTSAVAFSAPTYIVTEDSIRAVLQVTRTGQDLTGDITVDFQTVDGTARKDFDYQETTGTVEFADGDATPQLVVIPIINNLTVQPSRSFSVELIPPPSGEPVLAGPDVATVTITDNDTGLQFSQGTIDVNSGEGQATITVQRTGVLSGPVSINWTSQGDNAQAGVDFGTLGSSTPPSGTLNFADGETTKTFTIPVFRDNVNPTVARRVLLTLSNGTSPDGVDIANTENSTATLKIHNSDVPPIVSNIAFSPQKGAIKSIALTFSKDLAQANAVNPASYQLFSRNGDSAFGSGKQRPIKITGVDYNQTTHTVTLFPSRSLGANQNFQLVVRASNGVVDLGGIPIDGNGDGDATGTVGDNYSVFISRGNNLSYIDSNGDRVSLHMRGGQMELVRNASGDADLLTLTNVKPGAAVLSGTVKAKGPNGDGQTTIRKIVNINGVNSRLNPSIFHVGTIV